MLYFIIVFFNIRWSVVCPGATVVRLELSLTRSGGNYGTNQVPSGPFVSRISFRNPGRVGFKFRVEEVIVIGTRSVKESVQRVDSLHL